MLDQQADRPGIPDYFAKGSTCAGLAAGDEQLEGLDRPLQVLRQGTQQTGIVSSGHQRDLTNRLWIRFQQRSLRLLLLCGEVPERLPKLRASEH